MNNSIYTVTQLNNHSKSILENNINNIWVEGEISSFKLYDSGHAYFFLKDDNSEISCVWFNYNSKQELSNGAKVTIYGNVTIYSNKGKFQIIVNDSYLTGLGNQWLELKKLKNKLSEEGLFDKKFKKKLPEYPMSIGIITSLNGSVIKDIVNIYSRRAPYLKVVIYDCNVQGQFAIDEICDGIYNLNKNKNLDILIIARGGGTPEELMVFNNEKIARSIFSSRIPIISAIGHETDFTISDLVSDFRASTPSEAAEISVKDKVDLIQQIDFLNINIYKNFDMQIDNYLSEISNLFNYNIMKEKINQLNTYIESTSHYKKNIINHVLYKIENYIIELKGLKKILLKNNIESLKKIGFSILKRNNNIINDISKIKLNEMLTLEVSNGKIKIIVKELFKNEKK